MGGGFFVKKLRKVMLLSCIAFSIVFLITGCNSNKGELSRSKAAEMIKKSLKEKIRNLDEKNTKDITDFFKNTIKYEKEEHEEFFSIPGGADKEEVAKYKKLEQQGFVITGIIPPNYNGTKFTDKAKPYIIWEGKFQGWPRREDRVVILLAEVDKVEVTGITTPPGGETGQKIVDFIIQYKPTPFGELLLEKEDLKSKGQSLFNLYDDGWRIMTTREGE